MKPKKKKRKRRKKTPPKPRSAIAVAKNPKPYQFNLYTPPFPSVIYHQPKANAVSQNVANTFRNIQAVNAKELERLRGDFTAYRQESQTIFKKLVAFPRDKIYYDDETVSDFTKSEDEVEAEDRLIDEEDDKIVRNILEQDKEQEEREGMGAEDVSTIGEETFMTESGRGIEDVSIDLGGSQSTPKKSTIKSKAQLRDELARLPEQKKLIYSKNMFKKISKKEIQKEAENRGISLRK